MFVKLTGLSSINIIVLILLILILIFLNGFNICPIFVQQKLNGVGQMLDERNVQTVSKPFNIFKNKENVESMLNESLNQFKFDSTPFQQAFSIFLSFQQF